MVNVNLVMIGGDFKEEEGGRNDCTQGKTTLTQKSRSKVLDFLR